MANGEKVDREQDGGAWNWGRRSFLAAGAAALGSSMTEGSEASSTSSSSATSNTTPHASGQLEVGKFGYETIGEAWEAAPNGAEIRITPSYDAQEAGEEFPIVLDNTEKQVTLQGTHPSGSVIDAGDANANVIEVLGLGQNEYWNNPIVESLKITGGQIGIYIRASPFAEFEDVILYDTGSHGVLIDEYTSEDRVFKGSFGITFFNCQAWNCDGDGFRSTKAAHPHETSYIACNSVSNKGAGYRLRGTASRILGGDAQLNYDFGIDARSGRSISIDGVYVEGNSRGRSYPIDVYAKSTPSLGIENCYLHGINPRSSPGHDYQFVQRGVHLQNVPFGTLENCAAYRYGEGLIGLYGCTDVDINRHTHYKHNSPLLANTQDDVRMVKDELEKDGNERIRTNGIILPGDLRGTEGKFTGDFGLHVGKHGGPAFWWNGSWYVAPVQEL